MSKALSMIRARLNALDLVSGVASPIAGAGVAAPVGSQYEQTIGIPWLKMGSTDTSWTQELLRAPYFNVKTFGATGDGVTDDRAAIQLAINAAIAAGGGVVFFPPGTYACFVVAGITIFTMSGSASSGVLFMGCGRSSALVMSGNGTSTDRRLFNMTAGCKRIGFKSLMMRSALTNENEQQHLIHFENTVASVIVETGQSFILDCYFGHTRGDAVRFLGANNTNRVRDILCKRCVFEMDNTPASRTCFSFQRAVDDVTLDANYCTGAGPVDFEPSGVGSNTSMRILRNHFEGSVTLSGNGSDDQSHSDTIYAHNTTMQGVSQAGEGNVSGGNISRLLFTGNIVDINISPPAASEAFAISFFKFAHDLVIDCNQIYVDGNTSTVLMVDVANLGGDGDVEGIVTDSNIVQNLSGASDGAGVSYQDVRRGLIVANLIRLEFPADNGQATQFIANNRDIFDLAVTANMGIGIDARFENAIIVGATGFDCGPVSCTDNFIRHTQRGARLSQVTDASVFGRNVFADANVGAVVLNAPLTSIPIDGTGTDLGPTIYQLQVDPAGVVDAAIGSYGLRSTGGGAGTTLYVKEGDSGGNTGWDAK
jgi:hypothetical protein